MKEIGLAVLAILSLSATAKDPWSFGFISTNVDCNEPEQPKRIKFVSQTFAYCAAEVPRNQIIEDQKVFFNQVVKSSCGERYSISYQYVNVSDSEARAEEEREKSLREPGYGKYVPWQASVDYPSTKCR